MTLFKTSALASAAIALSAFTMPALAADDAFSPPANYFQGRNLGQMNPQAGNPGYAQPGYTAPAPNAYNNPPATYSTTTTTEAMDARINPPVSVDANGNPIGAAPAYVPSLPSSAAPVVDAYGNNVAPAPVAGNTYAPPSVPPTAAPAYTPPPAAAYASPTPSYQPTPAQGSPLPDNYGSLQAQNQNGINYVSGGVGMAERDQLKSMARDFNLKLTLAAKNGDYLSDTNVVISKPNGEQVLDAQADGPLFYAKLPAGTYKVQANVNGSSKTQNVTVGNSGQRAIGFYWDSIASNDTYRPNGRN